MRRAWVTYLGGPMTGLPHYNYPEFSRISDRLRTDGFLHVRSAHELGGDAVPGSLPYAIYVKLGITQLLKCQQALFMPDFVSSRGAMLEFQIAVATGLHVYTYEGPEPNEFVRLA